MKVKAATTQHEIAYQDLIGLVRKHADHLSAAEMLAIAANMVGKLVAMQDQRSMSPDQAMQIVASNLEAGNKQVLQQINTSEGSA